jgi:hypothetical protein
VSDPVKVAGPLPDPEPEGNFYAYIDWGADFAWHGVPG